MNLEVTVSILSGATAATVSLAVVFLTRRSETISHLETLRASAYVDFIRSVAGLAVLQRGSIKSKEHMLKGSELIMLAADAKSRIAIYGGKSVVEALANFLRAEPQSTRQTAQRSFQPCAS